MDVANLSDTFSPPPLLKPSVTATMASEIRLHRSRHHHRHARQRKSSRSTPERYSHDEGADRDYLRRKCDVVKNPKLIKGISDHNSRPDQPSSHFPFLFSFMHCCHLNLVNSIKKNRTDHRRGLAPIFGAAGKMLNRGMVKRVSLCLVEKEMAGHRVAHATLKGPKRCEGANHRCTIGTNRGKPELSMTCLREARSVSLPLKNTTQSAISKLHERKLKANDLKYGQSFGGPCEFVGVLPWFDPPRHDTGINLLLPNRLDIGLVWDQTCIHQHQLLYLVITKTKA
ncbi:hypothetical protein HID58_049333 [Brassica napus]|uniref:Uncharacterized protein n=1 Tax=Brassica napus TaxID=3708 RepID=A0ABQ8B4Q7_BRANA|nr:hypothetical protein HID58_049333 [Brassica napus]